MIIWRKKFINLSPSVLLSKEFSNQAEMLNKRKLIEWEPWSHLVKIPHWIEEDMEPPEIFRSLSSRSPESLILTWILEKKSFEIHFVSTNVYSEFINVKLLMGFIQRWDRHSFKEHISKDHCVEFSCLRECSLASTLIKDNRIVYDLKSVHFILFNWHFIKSHS